MHSVHSWLKLWGQYKKGGLVDIGTLCTAGKRLIKLTISKSGELTWPVAVASPAGGSKVSDSASARVLPGLFPSI